jgi:hypothetical protein
MNVGNVFVIREKFLERHEADIKSKEISLKRKNDH